jgi:type IV secretion system protein VirB3
LSAASAPPPAWADDVSELDRDILFVALTRPQTFAGVTYSVVILNIVISTELFLVLKSPLIVAFALLFHLAAWLACLREPRIFDIWLTKASRCPRTRTWAIWRGNCYRP